MLSKMLSFGLACAFGLGLICSGTAVAQNQFDLFGPSPVEPAPKKTAPTSKLHTLNLPGVRLTGEEIDYKVKGDGKHDISLRGQAALKIDEIVITADVIDMTYSKIENAVLDLKGNVTISSKADNLRANAIEAHFDFSKKLLKLKGEAEKEAVLLRYNGSKTTLMEAAELEIQFSDPHLVSVKSQGPVQLSERKMKQEDSLFTSPFGSQDTLFAPQFPSTGFEAPPTPNFPQFQPSLSR